MWASGEKVGDGGEREMAVTLLLPWWSRGDTTSEPRAGGKEAENNWGEPGRQPGAGSAGGAAPHVPRRCVPLSSLSRWPRALGAAASPPAWIPVPPLGLRSWWPFVVYWVRVPHRETFLESLDD